MGKKIKKSSKKKTGKIFEFSNEFAEKKHDIYWLDPDLLKYTGGGSFVERPMPSFQKLPRAMHDAEIESELKPGHCTLGDILTFLDNAPKECKDGYANIFYFPGCVVSADWSAGRGWHVGADLRGGLRWRGGLRVVSPATGSSSLPSIPSESLPLELKVNGFTYRRVV